MEGFTEQDVYEPPPPAEYFMRIPLVSADTYSTRQNNYQTFARSEGPEYENRVVMRGAKECLRIRYGVGLSTTWRGFAYRFTKRYLRRYYPDTVFFKNDDLRPILRKVCDRFPMMSKAIDAYYDDFRLEEINQFSTYDDCFSALIDGKIEYMDYDQYRVCLRINNQINQLEKLEKMKDEQEKAN